MAQTGRDILSNERGSVPGDRVDDWWQQMREQLGEELLPPDIHSHDPHNHDVGEPEHDIDPDLGMER